MENWATQRSLFLSLSWMLPLQICSCSTRPQFTKRDHSHQRTSLWTSVWNISQSNAALRVWVDERTIKGHFISNRTNKNNKYACATRSSLPWVRFHIKTRGRIAFTWCQCRFWKSRPSTAKDELVYTGTTLPVWKLSAAPEMEITAIHLISLIQL